MKARIYIGVDNGLSGAVAVLDDRGKPKQLFELPTFEREGAKKAHVQRSIDVRLLASKLLNEVCISAYEAHVMIERPFANDKIFIGMVASMFEVYGTLVSVFVLAGAFQVSGVVPRTWKKKFGLDDKKVKALAIARGLFPQIDLRYQKDHNKADALLISEHCRQSNLIYGGKAA